MTAKARLEWRRRMLRRGQGVEEEAEEEASGIMDVDSA